MGVSDQSTMDGWRCREWVNEGIKDFHSSTEWVMGDLSEDACRYCTVIV